MDNAHFVKLLTDCGLLDARLTNIDADIIFSKVGSLTCLLTSPST